MKRALPEFITNTGKNFEKREYDKATKNILIQYMNTCGELYAAAGYVDDLVTGKFLKLANGGYRDDQFEWSTQEIYHLEKYDAAVTDEFLHHVLMKMAS